MNFQLDTIAIKKAAMIIRSVNHKLRNSIIKLLLENDKLTVTEIFIKLRLEQSVASQNLSILRRSGFAETTREGKNIYYSINKEKLASIQSIVLNLIEDYKAK